MKVAEVEREIRAIEQAIRGLKQLHDLPKSEQKELEEKLNLCDTLTNIINVSVDAMDTWKSHMKERIAEAEVKLD